MHDQSRFRVGNKEIIFKPQNLGFDGEIKIKYRRKNAHKEK